MTLMDTLFFLLQIFIFLYISAAASESSTCPELPGNSLTTISNCSYLNNAGSLCTIKCKEGYIASSLSQNYSEKYCMCTKNKCTWTGPDIQCQKHLQGTWSAWGMYSECSKTCGSGVMTRTRTCITAANVTNSTTNGTSCVGEAVNNAICLISLCSAADGRKKINKYEIALGGIIAIVTFSYGVLLCVKLRKGPCRSRRGVSQGDDATTSEEDLPPSYINYYQYQLRNAAANDEEGNNNATTDDEALPLYDNVVESDVSLISTDPPSYSSYVSVFSSCKEEVIIHHPND